MVPKEYEIGTVSSLAALLGSAAGPSSEVCSLVSESQCYRGACNSGNESEKESLVSELHPQKSTVNMRSVFVPFPGGVFLAADYSQLELRILAHMSGDKKTPASVEQRRGCIQDDSRGVVGCTSRPGHS